MKPIEAGQRVRLSAEGQLHILGNAKPKTKVGVAFELMPHDMIKVQRDHIKAMPPQPRVYGEVDKEWVDG